MFSFADDDLCAWVSEPEVAEFLAAEFDWDGIATEQGQRQGCLPMGAFERGRRQRRRGR